MFKKIKQKIKKYFSETFAPENQEKGLGVTGTLLVGALAIGGITWLVAQLSQDFTVGIGRLFISIGGAAMDWTSGWLMYVLGPTFTTRPIVGYPAFDQAWGSVRDLTNMLIVLGFVAVGIATTLRFQEYAAKKILPVLIGVAILINFSGFFCGIIINGANITTTALLSQGSASGMFGQTTNMIASWVKDNMESNKSGVDPRAEPGAYMLVAASAMVMMLFASWIFIILAVLLAARFAMLAMLYILSPLAFFFFIFPVTKPKFKEWWDNFLQWSFLGVTTGFFIYLAMTVMVAGMGGGKLNFDILFVSFIFLYIGYKMARKGAAAGSTAILGLAAGAASMAMGGAAILAKGGGAALANSRLGQKTQRGLTRAGEALRVVPRGTANLMEQEHKQSNDTDKRSGTWTADQRRNKALNRTATSPSSWTKTGRNDQIKAAKDMIEKHELGGLSPAQQATVVRRATADGTPLNAKGDYRAFEHNPQRVEAVRTSRGLGTGPAAEAAARGIIRQEQLQQLLPSMTEEQQRNISAADITPELLTSKAMSTKVARSWRTAGAAQLGMLGNTVTHTMHPGLLTDFNVRIANANNSTHPDYNTNEARRLKDIRNEIQSIL